MTASDIDDMLQRVRRGLEARSFLFDCPDDYVAGVSDALTEIERAEGLRLVAIHDEGREQWLRALEHYRTAVGSPGGGAGLFETRLEQQLSRRG